MQKVLNWFALTAVLIGVVLGGLLTATSAQATAMPMPSSCAHSTFGEMHDGYLWWFRYTGQRFSGGTYYNSYDVGLTSYPVPVRYVGSIEKACGHSSYVVG